MTQTVAIYSRFSTTLQTEKSTADQIALCKDYAAAQGWRVVSSYADEAKSGASTIGRAGFNAMLADAMNGKFNIILAAGASPMNICRALNREGVPSPRGSIWAPANLVGMAARGHRDTAQPALCRPHRVEQGQHAERP